MSLKRREFLAALVGAPLTSAELRNPRIIVWKPRSLGVTTGQRLLVLQQWRNGYISPGPAELFQFMSTLTVE